MTYQVQADDGSLLDAHLDIDDAGIVFHSRGGTKGSGARNVHYSLALRLLFERLQAVDSPVEKAWVDSSRVQGIPLKQRVILDAEDMGASARQLVSRMGTRMQAIGRESTSLSSRGNATKRIRLQIPNVLALDDLVAALRIVPTGGDTSSAERLPASELQKVNASHLWDAAARLRGGFQDHGFADSEKYDVLLEDGVRLPPKALFGVAATSALGFEVLPKHFSAGLSSVSFRLLKDAGYHLVEKGHEALPIATTGNQVDREWVEGTPKLRLHLSRERADGLREAKKADFRAKNGGALFCEACGMDPVKQYGSEDAEVCIEVHHRRVQVAEMKEKHITRLTDVVCLCANCHRLEHRLIRKGTAKAVG